MVAAPGIKPSGIAPLPFISVGSRSALAFLFRRNINPTNPSTTKTDPATINQCGYCIAESYFFARKFQASQAATSAALRASVARCSAAINDGLAELLPQELPSLSPVD
jgi:hypothetical protein